MLYNKYRPRRVAELRGQENISTFIKGITEETTPKSIILAGPSGTGKTTAAKLIAQKLYCTNPTNDGDVCGVCEGCQAVINGTNQIDYMEIDATSYGKVDQIRGLKDKLSLTPFWNSGLRVVYFDEAHNLTKQAWDALLTVIEEATHNVFLFATTEPQKIPKTIKTRSVFLEFKEANAEDIANYLMYVAKQEGYDLDENAAKIIAFTSEGSYRQALSLLETVIRSLPKGQISVDDLSKVSGVTTKEDIDALRLFREGYYAKKTEDEWKNLIAMLTALPDNERSLRGIASYIEKAVLSSISKYPSPSEKALARLRLLSYISEINKDKTTSVTKSSIVNAITKYLESRFTNKFSGH